MTDHPSREELLAVVRGGLTPQRAGAILVHLYKGCETCLAAAPTAVAAWFGVKREPTVEEEADTDAAIDRAFASALREDRDLRQRQARVTKGVKILAEGGLAGPERLPRSMKQIDKFEALLAASWSLRHENTGVMIFFARLALECAEQLDPRKYGAKRVSDLQCRAKAELGNALRITDQFKQAEAAMNHARRLFELGTHDRVIEIHLLDLEASLDADLRRFHDATWRLRKVYRYYKASGNHHLAGRTLLTLGLYTGYSGDTDKALRLLRESVDLIDAEQDPSLLYAALHNQIWFLLDAGCFPEAERQLFQLRPLQPYAGGRLNCLRLRWMEGRIDAGQNRLSRSEERLLEVRDAFLESNRAYDSALASLDLSAVLLAQKKAQEATEVVAAAYKIFMALEIQREGLMAVLLLRMACEMRQATRDFAERVARYLRRLENDPKAKFEDEV